MAEWALGYLEMRVPFDVEIRNNYSHSFISEANISNANELPALDYSEVVDYLNEKGYDVNNYCEVKKYFINEEEYYNIDQKNISMIGIRLSDFNKMRRMLGYEEANDFQNNYVHQWFRKNNEDFVEKYSKDDDVSYSVLTSRIKLSERNNILNITLAMRILGIYLGCSIADD